MIDRSEFARAWTQIVARFGKVDDPQQAAAYYAFLSEQMDTGEFLQAARALWATAKWFPRPADFLLLAAAGEWPTVLKAVEEYTPPHGLWHEHWKRLSPRAVEACKRIGGIAGMRTVYERDVLKLKDAWERAYEQATTEAVLALPAPQGSPQLKGAA